MEVIGNENTVITMIVVFALVIGPLSGVWNLLLSRIVGGGAHETFFIRFTVESFFFQVLLFFVPSLF